MKAVMKPALKAVGAAAVACAALNASAATVTIATLNNPDMIELKKLSPAFEQANPDIKLNSAPPPTSRPAAASST
jgi:sorbitol/mannitol transport system substrate-binding protein